MPISSDKQTLSLTNSVLTISGGNSVTLPEAPSGLDCAAIGALTERAYKKGDSVLVHNADGTCARILPKPGIFTDVRVGMVTQYSSVFTNTTSDIITTVQNLADSKATVRLKILTPTTNTALISEVIDKPANVTVTKISEGVFDISNLGYGEKVIITDKVRFDVKGNYGFSSTISISETGLFDYSTNDDYASTSVAVTNASAGNPTTSCPLAHIYGPDGVTELPVQEYGTADGNHQKSIVILTDDIVSTKLHTGNVKTVLPHISQMKLTPPGANSMTFDYGNFSTYMTPYMVNNTTPDALGITLQGNLLDIPPPQQGYYYYGHVELAVGASCKTQIINVYIMRKSDLQPQRGVITVTPTPVGGSVAYSQTPAKTVDVHVVDKTITNRDGKYGNIKRVATVTIPSGTGYNGVATLSGNTSKYSSTGAVSLTPNAGYSAVNIAVLPTATTTDSVVNFYDCINVNITA